MMAKKIFGCLGKASIWNAEGYSRTLGSYVGFSFGQGFGASNNALNDILKGHGFHVNCRFPTHRDRKHCRIL